TYLANWNDFIGPLLYLQSDSKKTIALGLATFLGLYSTNWELLMAAATTVTIPALILFLFCQRYFVEGVVLTGLQGV
ncbi:MAG: carbohydrate ABC transporter permease, partial [Caldilineaceae bacterium]|nr:carbohydrate ABC transporter permease [Caldilineaceae bacterium]